MLSPIHKSHREKRPSKIKHNSILNVILNSMICKVDHTHVTSC